jgi:hypothetical protein
MRLPASGGRRGCSRGCGRRFSGGVWLPASGGAQHHPIRPHVSESCHQGSRKTELARSSGRASQPDQAELESSEPKCGSPRDLTELACVQPYARDREDLGRRWIVLASSRRAATLAGTCAPLLAWRLWSIGVAVPASWHVFPVLVADHASYLHHPWSRHSYGIPTL